MYILISSSLLGTHVDTQPDNGGLNKASATTLRRLQRHFVFARIENTLQPSPAMPMQQVRRRFHVECEPLLDLANVLVRYTQINC
jgi:hypothetical protein